MTFTREMAKRLYQAFHDWRAKLYNDLHRLDADYLRALRADMQQVLDQVDHEVARRGSGRAVDDEPR
jgi:hypothetical protein